MGNDVTGGGADEVRRAKLKEAHALRSQFNYEVGNKRIDFKLDVIEPRLKEIAKTAVEIGELSEFTVEEN